MNFLVTITILIILYSYAKIYMKPKKSTELIQATLSNFTTDLLLEKQPVLVFDKIVNPHHVIKTFFTYLHHIKNQNMTIGEHREQQNYSRFAVLYNHTDTNQEVRIDKHLAKSAYKSKNMFYSTSSKVLETDATININLPEKNMLIVPYLYKFATEKPLQVTYLTDFIHVWC